MQNSRRAVPPRNLAAYLLRGALSATKGQAYLLETPPRDKGPGDLTGATQLVKESDSRPRRTFYTPPPLVSNRDETEACRPRPDAITRTPRAESRNFSDRQLAVLPIASFAFSTFDGKIIFIHLIKKIVHDAFFSHYQSRALPPSIFMEVNGVF